MTAAPAPIGDGETVTVKIPLRLRKRGGRKILIAPEGAVGWVPQRARVDNAMVKTIARAFRWRRLLEIGVHTTVEEIAAAEKINSSYVGRVLRLSLLAPDIVERIIDGRQAASLQLNRLLRPFPVGWEQQRRELGCNARHARKDRTSVSAKLSVKNGNFRGRYQAASPKRLRRVQIDN
jgi:hypothetical protein